MWTTLLSLFLIVAALAGICLYALRHLRANNSIDGEVARALRWPYQAKSILTEREQVLFHRLREAVPHFIVLAQVPLSQVIVVRPGTANRQAWLNKIIQKSVDFVVCRPDLSVVAVIELDDRSHLNAKQAARDADKTRALKDADVWLLRLPDIPSIEDLSKLLGQDSIGRTRVLHPVPPAGEAAAV
jgi:hypothetical protein